MATSLPLPLHPGVFDHLTSWLDAAFPLEAQAAAGVAPSSPFGSQTQAPAPALPPDGQTGPDLTAGSDPYAASPYEPTRLTPVPEPGFLQSALMNVLSQIPMMTPQPDRYGRMPHHFNRFAGIVGPLLAHGVAGGLESSIRARQADINAKNLVATQTAAANEKARIATISPSIAARQSGINDQIAARAAIDAARIRANAAPVLKFGETPIPTPPKMRKETGLEKATPGQIATYMKPPSPGAGLSGMGKLYGEVDAEALADAIHQRLQPPDVTQYGRPAAAATASFLQTKYHENYYAMNMQWKRMITNIRTMEGTRFTSLGVNLNSADKALDLLSQYSDELSKVAPRFSNLPMNDLAQKVQQNYNFGGPEVQAAVARLVSQGAATQLQLAGVYANGGTPTDQELRQARDIINFKAPPAVLGGQIDVGHADVQLRRDAYEGARMVRGDVQAPTVAPSDTGRVQMVAPDGSTIYVPQQDVVRARSLGAR